MATETVSSIAAFFTQALKTWQTHLERQRELYELHLQKKKDRALDTAEQMAGASDNIISYINRHWKMSDDQRKDIDRLIKNYDGYKRKFNKLD